MSRFLILIFVVLVIYYISRLLIQSFSSSSKKMEGLEPEELVQDPSCQTYIPKRSALKKRISGRDYYFCKKECLKNFIKNKAP